MSGIRVVLALHLVIASFAQVSIAQSVRSRAVVDLTFDEPNGDAQDAANAGAVKDVAKLTNALPRINSPFWNQRGNKAVRLDANRKQVISIADSPDVDATTGMTFSTFFLNLVPPGDAGYRGLFAKRDEGKVTNYGINFGMKPDNLQLYINDGTGYKLAFYSPKVVIPYRQMVHLTLTMSVGDAPAPDTDTDKDDVLLRLFLNGKLIKPRNATHGNDFWASDVKVSQLTNNVPLTIGSSFGENELVSGLYDEILFFGAALSPQDVAKLFVEVAGPNGAALAKHQTAPVSQQASISAVSPHALRVGHKTRLTITGVNLKGGETFLPGVAARYDVVDNQNPNRLIVDVTLPPGQPRGFVPVRVYTAGGLSNAKVIALDDLPQFDAAGSSPTKPATLPGAFSGVITGSQQPRVYFAGKKDQRVIAEVEAKRLGARLKPVVEIKTDRGAPLAIQWNQPELGGDARCEVKLPADGIYFVELHDLAYKASGRNEFRLKIGDLKIVDALLPHTVPAGHKLALQPVGIGLGDRTVEVTITTSYTGLPEATTITGIDDANGPLPFVTLSDSVEVLEQTGDKPQTLDATFPDTTSGLLGISGRISKSGESDSYQLKVTEGQELNFFLEGRSIGSALDAEMSVLLNGKPAVTKQDRPGSRDPEFNYTVPKGVKSIGLTIRDFTERGGDHFFYRVQIARRNRPDFRLEVLDRQINLPANGSVPIRLKVTRSGNSFQYHGPIKLGIAGAKGLTVIPHTLPASDENQTLFVLLARNQAVDARIQTIQLVGEAVGTKREVIRAANANVTGLPTNNRIQQLSAGRLAATSISLYLSDVPPALFKGDTASLKVGILDLSDTRKYPVRFSTLSTETTRLNDPKNAGSGNKPLVQAVQTFAVTTGDSAIIPISVPLDVAASTITLVVRGQLVEHEFSDRIHGTAYTSPFTLPVQSAVEISVDKASLQLKSNTTHAVRGTLKRTFGFDKAVSLSIAGLPKGYNPTTVTIAADKSAFEIPVVVPKQDKPIDLPKVVLTVKVAGGGAILPNQPLAVKVLKTE
jgi:hypothetical protein